MNKELIQKDKEDKAIKFYTNYIQAQEKELDWMYRQDEEYYRDEIEQKELLIKGFKTILNLIEKQSKEIEELKKDKLELINKNHVVHLKDVEKELREMRKEIDTKNAEIECLNVIHESYKEMVEENNFISKDKLIELREIDNIDLIQCKLRKLLED